MSKIAHLLNTTPLYGMTAEDLSFSHDNISDVSDMLESGIKVIQYREKEKNYRYMYEQCLKIREMTRKAGAFLIIDDHVDLALAVGADGVHIGQEDLPLEAVRRIAGDRLFIGLSTHSPEQALDAKKRGADYIGVGPIYETHTKKNVCAPVGLSYLDYVAQNIDLPFVAIGGIKKHNLKEVYDHGAKCACLVTGIVGNKDIKQTVSELMQIRGWLSE